MNSEKHLATNLNNIIKFDILNADKIRAQENDWDFSLEGRLRQANRMKVYADRLISEGKNIIADFICPTKNEKIFSADYIIWMNTIKKVNLRTLTYFLRSRQGRNKLRDN